MDKPVVGQGATLLMLTDRHAYTIVEVSPSGKTIKAQRDTATRTDNNGMSESQSYSFSPDTSAEVEVFRLNNKGHYRNKVGTRLSVGERNAYHDYSF